MISEGERTTFQQILAKEQEQTQTALLHRGIEEDFFGTLLGTTNYCDKGTKQILTTTIIIREGAGEEIRYGILQQQNGDGTIE